MFNQEDTSGCRMANASEVLENEDAFCQREEPGVLGDAEKDGWRGGVWEGRVVTEIVNIPKLRRHHQSEVQFKCALCEAGD
ncbi:hypothetical protein U0070_013499, partial [Myodes glareolus]